MCVGENLSAEGADLMRGQSNAHGGRILKNTGSLSELVDINYRKAKKTVRELIIRQKEKMRNVSGSSCSVHDKREEKDHKDA